MKLRILESSIRVATVRARMPFRYGIAAMTRAPHVFVEVLVETNGKTARGVAADHLPPKWFTKNPATSLREDVADMCAVIVQAADAAPSLGQVESVFDAWLELYALQSEWANAGGFPPLLANFGVSLVERAMIDGFCRATGTTFARAVRENAFAMRLAQLDPTVSGEPHTWLPPEPLSEIIVRHTVGLSDPLTDAEIPPAERLADGLPQSLADCLATHGLTHLKIKLAGDPQRDIERLRAIAALIGERCVFTLDGNENYASVARFRELWEALLADIALTPFMRGLIAVEQPLHRDAALTDATASELRAWPDRPPLIIDESDADLHSLPAALAIGYAGTSHKNCKGIFKGLLNTCRLRQRAAAGEAVILTAEDLSNIGPVALLQDLAVIATLGIPHAERNGHHYFAGLSPWPAAIQQATLAAHPDLYEAHPSGFPAVRVRSGKVEIRSVVAAPFGCGMELDLREFPLLADWPIEV